MELLEREPQLAALGDYATEAASGSGRLVLVTGEAGIGKTALVDAFRASRADLRWLWGACDGGFTPRPLGPVHEIAAAAGGRLRELCSPDGDRNELFASFADLLAGANGSVGVVVEDLHWADEATLDWLAYLARRIGRSRALVIATYRDADPGSDHVLASMMGRLAAHGSTRRMTLPPLGPDAVRRLSGDRDAAEVLAVTGGNPFLVTEVLASTSDAVPPSVADVVRGRVLDHSPPAQHMLAAAAVLGRPAPAGLLAAVAGVAATALDECVASGTLVTQGDSFTFRHELTRRAVELGVPHVQAAELHRIALLALEREDADPAELTHHAVVASDADAVLRHAPRAGRAAAAASSHREAIVQFERALAHRDRLTADEHADLEEALAESLSTRDQWAEAREHWERVISLRRSLDDPVALSRCLRRYGACLWRLCCTEECEAAEAESFALMRDADDCAEKALSFYAVGNSELVPLAERHRLLDECHRIAKDLDDQALVGRALLALGFVDAAAGVVDFPVVEQALDAGLAANDATLTACVYTNLYEASIDQLRLDAYPGRYEEGLAYCLDHEQHTYSVCMRGSRVTELMRRGQNHEAIELALTTMAETISPVNRMHLAIGLTTAAFRIARPEARRWLELAWELGAGNDQTFWIVQIATAAVQGAWLTGDRSLVDDRVRAAYQRGLTDDPFVHGELTAWLDRLDHPVDRDRSLVPPFSLELAGEHAGAAKAWREIGCPFEEAVALTWTGEVESRRRALELFTGLDATTAALQVRRLLDDDGVRVPLPRGPRRSTRNHPAGLTAREVEVLELMRESLTNAEIAERLVLSTRTVDHHVSSILAKLGVRSRAEPVAHPGALAT